MSYIENPKMKGSGMLGCIPQVGECPNKCVDCFFQSGRSYLEPLKENLPNMPSLEDAEDRIIRMNDGNDSNVEKDMVINTARYYKYRFFNTSINENLAEFEEPVVLTLNPGFSTDYGFHQIDIVPKNLMFVRFRTNTWNLDLLDKAIQYYSEREVPIVLTFMAYFNLAVSDKWKKDYVFRKRTLNSYWAITTEAWSRIMDSARCKFNKWVYSCGKIEGEKGTTACRHCGNCIREFFATKERIRGE